MHGVLQSHTVSRIRLIRTLDALGIAEVLTFIHCVKAGIDSLELGPGGSRKSEPEHPSLQPQFQ